MNAFADLLRTAPTPLRLVITTRHDPPLPLHLLRASGELSELRGKDLAFTAAEAADYLAALDVDLPAEGQARLVDVTEGWAAGLRLFTLSRARNGDDGELAATLELDDLPVAEYLS